jgi:hypothetical protein
MRIKSQTRFLNPVFELLYAILLLDLKHLLSKDSLLLLLLWLALTP